jgi:creatinase
MEPMIMIPEGQKGAGGYREHDILVITEKGNRNITGFPYGPEHLIVKGGRGSRKPAAKKKAPARKAAKKRR